MNAEGCTPVWKIFFLTTLWELHFGKDNKCDIITHFSSTVEFKVHFRHWPRYMREHDLHIFISPDAAKRTIYTWVYILLIFNYICILFFSFSSSHLSQSPLLYAYQACYIGDINNVDTHLSLKTFWVVYIWEKSL